VLMGKMLDMREVGARVQLLFLMEVEHDENTA